MTVSSNANEFRDKFQQVLGWYNATLGPMLEAHRQRYDRRGIPMGP